MKKKYHCTEQFSTNTPNTHYTEKDKRIFPIIPKAVAMKLRIPIRKRYVAGNDVGSCVTMEYDVGYYRITVLFNLLDFN